MGWVIICWIKGILPMWLVMVPIILHRVTVLHLVLYLHWLTHIWICIYLVVPLLQLAMINYATKHLTWWWPIPLSFWHTSPCTHALRNIYKIFLRISQPMLILFILLHLNSMLTPTLHLAVSLSRLHIFHLVVLQVEDDPPRWWLLKLGLIHLYCLPSAAVNQ